MQNLTRTPDPSQLVHAKRGLLPCPGKWALCLLAALSTSVPATAKADEVPLDDAQPGEAASNLADLSIEELMNYKVDVVYGASRYAQRVTRAPSSISIVTADEMRKLGYRTLAEALRGVRGLYVSNDRNYSYLGVRGFLRPGDYSTRILVLIDGHRVNDNLFDSGTVAREGMLDISLIDRVEVIRGPSSSIYGSSAFFGVINVITRRGSQVQGGELSLDVGSHDTGRGVLNLGGRSDHGFEWLASAADYESAGAPRIYVPEYDERISDHPAAANNGLAEGIDDERVLNLYTRLSYGDFTLTGYYNDRTKQVPTASYQTVFNDPRERTTDARGYLDFGYDHSFNASLRLQGRVTLDSYDYDGLYPYADEGGDPSATLVLRDGTIGEWIGTQWQLEARAADRHTLIVGGEYQENIREYQFAYYEVEPITYDLRDDRSSRKLGVYAQHEMELPANLQLTVGLRYDYYLDSFGGTVSPRLGLIYGPTDTTTFKALFGDAYRAPNPYERYYHVAQRERPELRPERIRTFELIAEHQIGSHYRLNASAYYYRTRDLINAAFTDEGDAYFDNLQSVRATGLELEAEARYESGLLARASYTLQRTRDGESDRSLSSSPQHLAKLSLIVPLVQGKVFTSLDLQHNGSSDTVYGGAAAGFTTANLTLYGSPLWDRLNLSLSVYNLLDEKYGYPGAEDHVQPVIEQDGRTVRASATYSF